MEICRIAAEMTALMIPEFMENAGVFFETECVILPHRK
jgi:hypothetical protein